MALLKSPSHESRHSPPTSLQVSTGPDGVVGGVVFVVVAASVVVVVGFFVVVGGVVTGVGLVVAGRPSHRIQTSLA